MKFIWYPTPDDEVGTFIRLNKNKISLTNAELIKAMLLRKGNYDGDKILMQEYIASEWNTMEDMFHDDAFWYFLRPATDCRATRLDYLFQIIKDKNRLGFTVDDKKIGTDQYSTFRYFNEFFKQNKKDAFSKIWQEMRRLYNIFVHWYNEVELYHYIGLLAEAEKEDCDVIYKLLDEWKDCQSVEEFKESLYSKIKIKLGDTKDLNKEYEVKKCPKTQCRFLLLLFNVETILIRNRNMQQIAEVQIPHKFPFFLLKKEKWDIEHIASNTDNDLKDKKSQNEWLQTFLLDEDLAEDKKVDIVRFIKEGNGDFNMIKGKLLSEKKEQDSLNDSEKNKVWNFCLLDQSTNRSYGNSIFPVKRKVIMGKELGEQYEVTIKDGKVKAGKVKDVLKGGNIAYVPACTMNVFLKAYTATTTSPREWTKKDAEAYQQQIYDTLYDKFGITK